MSYPLNHATTEVEQLRSTVQFLAIALACAIQPTNGAMARQVIRNLRPPMTQAELDKLADTWNLNPDDGEIR